MIDRYTARINALGNTPRERVLAREARFIASNKNENPSAKTVFIDGEERTLFIDRGTQPFYKVFQTMPGEVLNPGDYIEWNSKHWIVKNADSDTELYCYGDLRECNHRLFWQTKDGAIHSRWAFVQNASAYNRGEAGDKVMSYPYNSYMVTLPFDDETMDLTNGMRVHVSRQNKNVRPYRVTRPDDMDLGFGDNGVLELMVSQDEIYENDQFVSFTIDGEEISAWICNYIEPKEVETVDYIIHGSDVLPVGFSHSYSLYANEKEVTSPVYTFSIDTDYDGKITLEGQTISCIPDDTLDGESFRLTASIDGEAVADKIITIDTIF